MIPLATENCATSFSPSFQSKLGKVSFMGAIYEVFFWQAYLQNPHWNMFMWPFPGMCCGSQRFRSWQRNPTHCKCTLHLGKISTLSEGQIKKQNKDANMLFFGDIIRTCNLISVERILTSQAFLIWSVCGKHSLSCKEKILFLSSKAGAQWNCWSKRSDSRGEAVLARPWCLLQAASRHGWKLISILSYLREAPWCIHVKSEQKNLLCTGFFCSRLLHS